LLVTLPLYDIEIQVFVVVCAVVANATTK